MKFSEPLLVLVSVGATTVAALPQISESPSSCLGTDSVLLQTRNFTTSAGDILRVENRACSGARSTNSGHSKRQTVVDACVLDETINFQCFNIPNGVGPNAADCNKLNAAIIETFEAAGDVDLFSVTNNTVAQFSLGTCGYAWINDNPTDTLEFCFSEITVGAVLLLKNEIDSWDSNVGIPRP
ncbi:hypothetical protein FB45DRAFT_858688 [Roridomyces roridus]|uniref:Cyanovirin-N domain-containing protein n=1 Tax=Roridomyces roridus TaxID=1738132 RepID=A0AAD7FY76_9AGAR|nr:hypothetical protein FB45DRAFT_858688 [Roridomyces roridus]